MNIKTTLLKYKRQFISLVAILLLSFTALFAQSKDYQDGEIYLKIFPETQPLLKSLFDNETKTGLLKEDFKITSMKTPFYGVDSGLNLVYRIQFERTDLGDSLIKTLQQYDFIEYAEKVPLYRISYVPDDFNSNVLWGLAKINATQAWDISKGSANVVVAVVDNAVRITHQDLQANIWINPGINDGYSNDINGWDIADNDNNPNPPPGINSSSDFNHGTHVAGIVSAVTDNNKGIASLGFSCKIMAVKCAPNNSSGQYLSNPFDGVYYAALAKANIVNMSFESSAKSSTEQAIADFAYSQGIVLVAAAGNDTSNIPRYPAAFNHVIGVGATDRNDKITYYSNFGTNVTVMAPGGDGRAFQGNKIYSTFGFGDNAYGYYQGTSMASPLVCGLAGLVLSANPKLSPNQVKSYIEQGCVNIDALNPNLIGQLGYGRINAYNTLKLVQSDLGNYTNSDKITIYPNPSNGTFNLQFYQDYSNTDITIDVYNTLGSKIYEEKLTNYSSHFHSLDLSSLAIGLYIVQINAFGSVINMKISKG